MYSPPIDFPMRTSAKRRIRHKIKMEYIHTLELICSSQSPDETPYLISLAKKDELIKRIWQEEIKSNNIRNYTNFYRGKFKVVFEKDEFNVMIKQGDIFKLMPPYETIFDIVWELHITNSHDISDFFIGKVMDKYFVPGKAIRAVINHCGNCAFKIVPENRPYYCCNLDLIKMDSYDHCFNTLMICEDAYTGFIHLRPLTSEKQENEICLELFKIFMDFGTPKQLNISDPIFEIAIDKFKKLTRSTPVDITLVRKELNEQKASNLKTLLKKWSENCASSNWAIGCYILQRKLNSEIQGNCKIAPFKNVFVFNKNNANLSENDSEPGPSNAALGAKLGASSSNTDEFNDEAVAMFVDGSSKLELFVDEKQLELVDKPADDFTLEDGAFKKIVTLDDDNTEFAENKENLTDENDDVWDSEYPKCVGIEIESDDMLDDENSKSVESTEPDSKLDDGSEKSSKLNKETETILNDEVPHRDGLNENPDAILIDDDGESKNIEMQTEPVVFLAVEDPKIGEDKQVSDNNSIMVSGDDDPLA